MAELMCSFAEVSEAEQNRLLPRPESHFMAESAEMQMLQFRLFLKVIWDMILMFTATITITKTDILAEKADAVTTKMVMNADAVITKMVTAADAVMKIQWF